MKPNLFKKARVLLLSFALVFTMMPAAAFAQESQVSFIEGEVTDVATAAELETALNDGKENIRITSDFSVDRTFFITKDVIIFTEEAHTSGGYVVDFPATAEESGVCHSECTTCGKILDIKKTSETA